MAAYWKNIYFHIVNNYIEKILHLLGNDAVIADNLFMYAGSPGDIRIFTGIDGDNYDFKGVRWLFRTHHQNLALIGIRESDDSIMAIDDEGGFCKVCDGLQNLAYEIIRLDCGYTKNGTVAEYFEKYSEHDFKGTLLRYEQWCDANSMVLDEENVYHDKDGELFTVFFEKD